MHGAGYRERGRPRSQASRISIVIPTITGRERWVERCAAEYNRTCPGCEIIIVKDEPSCGHAWIKGYEKSHGDYVHFTADDITPSDGWWQHATAHADKFVIPIANVRAPDGTRQTCDSPLGDLGTRPNILVPFMTRSMLEQGGWLAPIHYGSDDWINYLAAVRGIRVEECPGYLLTHHVANEGRNYMRRHADVLALVELMRAEGYVPPVYAQLEVNLRTSKTGLDNVRIRQLDAIVREQLRSQRGH